MVLGELAGFREDRKMGKDTMKAVFSKRSRAPGERPLLAWCVPLCNFELN